LGGRKSILPVKKLSGWVLTWFCVWSDVQICIWFSASEVTTLRRYTNLFIIIIVVIIIIIIMPLSPLQ